MDEKGPSEIEPEEYAVIAEFRRALRRFVRHSEQSARQAGITPQQHLLLLALRADPSRLWATVSELADSLQLSHHATVGLVDRCQEAGLVVRDHDPDDRRIVRVSLTPEGSDRLAEITARNLSGQAALREVTERLKVLTEE